MESSNIKTIIFKINNSCDNLEFSIARNLIEQHMQKLSNYSVSKFLNANASSLYRHLVHQKAEQLEKGITPLSRLDKLKINNINQYCTQFDISMLKRILKDSLDLIQRPDVQLLLNNDAKIILESMGAILGVGSNLLLENHTPSDIK